MKILFIFHEYNHTGATIVLYRNILWLKNRGIEVFLLITGHGSYEGEIRKLGKSYNWNEEVKTIEKHNLVYRIRRRLGIFYTRPKPYKEALIDTLIHENFDIIYANSICSSAFIRELQILNKPIVWHIHELELAINTLGKQHLEVHPCADIIIANSDATKINLIQNHNVDSAKIFVNYPTVNIFSFLSNEVNSSKLKAELNIPDDSFIIGTSGTVYSRKGCDAFLILIRIIDEIFPSNNFHFIWVGQNLNKSELEHDINLSGLRDKVTFTGNIENPIPYYNIFDVFISLSKEESFGLAAVEVSLLEKPIVYFDNTGGLHEIFSDKTGGEIPYLNLLVMANRLIELYTKPELRISLGKEAKELGKRFDEDLVMPGLLKILQNAVQRTN